MNKKIYAHLALLGAACAWGVMSPISKIAMEDAISGLAMAYFRMLAKNNNFKSCALTRSLGANREANQKQTAPPNMRK